MIKNNIKNIIKEYLWYFLCIILSLFLILSSSNNKLNYEKIENKLLEQLNPIFSYANSGIDWFRSISESFSLLINQKEKLAELYEKNAFLEHYYYLYKLLLAENKILKEEINYTKDYKYRFISGKIIARSNSFNNQEVLIDLGKEDSIEKGQWVLAKNQLFGRIIEVNKNNSRILLISSPLSRIPAIGINSREKFVVAGLALNHFACLHLKDRNSLIEEELVTTNNLDTTIPEGMILGTIIKENDVFYVKPIFNIDEADYVKVVKNDIRR